MTRCGSDGNLCLNHCRRDASFQVERLDKTVRAVRRALSMRRGRGVRVVDSMMGGRASSGSLHSPPPNVANMTEDSRAHVSETQCSPQPPTVVCASSTGCKVMMVCYGGPRQRTGRRMLLDVVLCATNASYGHVGHLLGCRGVA